MTTIPSPKIIDKMKELILLRGLPGSGKSTFAELIGGFRCEVGDHVTGRENRAV